MKARHEARSRLLIKFSHLVKYGHVSFPMGHMDAKEGNLAPVTPIRPCLRETSASKRRSQEKGAEVLPWEGGD